MRTLARITGVIFVVVGLLAAGLGVYEMVRAFTQPEPFMPSLFGTEEAEGMLLPLRLLVGGMISMQGLMTAALGEGLWLVASIAEHSKRSSDHLAKLVGQGQFRIP